MADDFFSINNFEKFNNSNFRDVCNKNLLIEKLTKVNFSKIIKSLVDDINDKKYTISNYKEYFRIKSNESNVVRRVISFELRDFFLYLYLIYQLQDEIAENRIENTYGGFRFSHKISKKEKSEEIIEEEIIYPTICKNEWAKYYGEFNEILYNLAHQKKYNYVAEIDIANFYDNINLQLLEESIRFKVNNSKAEVVSLLFYFLHFWDKKYNFYSIKTSGIPQDTGGEASRILANFYLQSYDEYIYKKCQELNIKYIRYSDDQVFLSDNIESLRTMVYLASKYLSKIYLNINNKKVSYESIDDFVSRKFSIEFHEKVEGMYHTLSDSNYYNNPTLFIKGLKKLIILINKSENVNYEYSNDIINWIKQDNYKYLFDIKSAYELNYLKNISKKLNIENDIIDIIKSFINICFDDYVIELISKVWNKSDLSNDCIKRINILNNL
ncbi:MAG TPA: reverse transcriptase domain-containing protein [Rickettsiales bacterium]|nr:reverse transcriptase domain-containing protein [Rickettsiales bacterium]